MVINFEKTRKDAEHKDHENTSYMKNMVGIWGNVSEVHSDINCVTVVTDTGIILSGLPVISKEWVNADENKDYKTGSRNLPPLGARVFVLAPTHTATGAFVLCSGYARGEKKKQFLFAKEKDDEDIEKKNNSEESVSQGGWKRKEFYKNGNFILESNDGEIHLEFNPAADDDESLEKQIVINAWGNEITINEDGVSYKDANDNSVSTTKDGLSFEDSKGNTIVSTSSSLKINDVLEVKQKL